MSNEEKKTGIIGETLKQLREQKGLSMAAIANEFGISLGAYQKYENNTRDVSTSLLKAIADFYNVSTDYLLGRTPVRAVNTLPKKALTEEQVREIDEAIVAGYERLPVESRRAFIKMMEDLFGNIFDREDYGSDEDEDEQPQDSTA